MAKLFLGTSGWNYKDWSKGAFYPDDLKQDEWLEFYAQTFDTVEVNNTFYRLPQISVFEKWRESVPEEFAFTVKASRYYTHRKLLLDPEAHVDLFLQRSAGLGDKLSCILFQLPPSFKYEAERLQALLDFVDWQQVMPGVRCALEFRHKSWNNDGCFEQLRAHNWSLVLADKPGFTHEGPLTADFVFVRRHGPDGDHGANYPEEMLQEDAQRVRSWLSSERDVYFYFNNDVKAYAVRNALRMRELL
jgi:uncharacterized protein YecE (DUF72 family)